MFTKIYKITDAYNTLTNGTEIDQFFQRGYAPHTLLVGGGASLVIENKLRRRGNAQLSK
jgi:hypothetical protein